MTGETIVVSRAGEPLDLIVWRHRGTTAGLVEETLSLNRGLAEHGPVLPSGLSIQLPARRAAAPVRETVKLWE